MEQLSGRGGSQEDRPPHQTPMRSSDSATGYHLLGGRLLGPDGLSQCACLAQLGAARSQRRVLLLLGRGLRGCRRYSGFLGYHCRIQHLVQHFSWCC